MTIISGNRQLHKHLYCVVHMVFVICFVILISPQLALSQHVPTFKVVGRVVDEKGKGLPGVGITISPQVYQTLWTSPYIGEVTDDNGKFVIEGVGNTEAFWRSGWFLYTRMRAPKPGYTLVDPPYFRSLQKLDKRFDGIPFFPEGKNVVDLGDVFVKFRYGNLEVVIPDKEKERFDWGNIVISVRHRDGVEVAARTLSVNNQKTLVNPDRTTLLMSLPEGRWKIEMMDLNHRKVLFTSKYVDVSPDETRTVLMENERH